MRKVRPLLLALCFAKIMHLPAYGQNKLQQELNRSDVNPIGLLDKFLDANPNAIEVKILSEGTMAYLCADADNLFVRVSVGNPQLFMRMLMQGLAIRIDPTGAKRNKHTILFPSARDVQYAMEPIQSQNMKQGRPDIGPLIFQMNKMGTVYYAHGKSYPMEMSRSHIELDAENETLDYYVLIPKEKMMKEKNLSSSWSIGLYLESPVGIMEGLPGEQGMQRPPSQGRMTGHPSQPMNDKKMEKLMKKKINVWETFPIDEVNSINLK